MTRRNVSQVLDDEDVHAIWDPKYPRAMLASGLLEGYVGKAFRGPAMAYNE